MSQNSETKHVDPMDTWNETMENLLGKEKWNSLNYWHKTCEVAAVQEWCHNNLNWFSSLCGDNNNLL